MKMNCLDSHLTPIVICVYLIGSCKLEENVMFDVIKVPKLQEWYQVIFLAKLSIRRKYQHSSTIFVKVKRKGRLSISLPLDCTKTSPCASFFDVCSIDRLVPLFMS